MGFEFPAFLEPLWPEVFAFGGERLDDPLRYFIGWSDGQAVATSSLILAAGVAGVYCVAALPEVRRKGIATAMTLAALRQARALGYRVAVLQATEMGAGVYRRIGFREYCTFGCYMRPGEAATGIE